MHAPKIYILRFVLFCFTSFSPVDTCKYLLVIFVFSLWNRCEQHKSKCFERSIYYLRSFKINSQVATMKSSVWCVSVRVNGWAKQRRMAMVKEWQQEIASERNEKKEDEEKTKHCKKRQPMRRKWIESISSHSPLCVLLDVIYKCDSMYHAKWYFVSGTYVICIPCSLKSIKQKTSGWCCFSSILLFCFVLFHFFASSIIHISSLGLQQCIKGENCAHE